MARQEATPAVTQKLLQFGELVIPADQRARRDRQVGRVEALQRRKVPIADLVDPLGGGEVLEAVRPEIDQEETAARFNQGGGRGRD